MFRTLIFINLGLILASLASGVVFLAKDNGKKNRVVTSLTFRVLLSFSLVLLLVTGYLTGNLAPHSLQ